MKHEVRLSSFKKLLWPQLFDSVLLFLVGLVLGMMVMMIVMPLMVTLVDGWV